MITWLYLESLCLSVLAFICFIHVSRICPENMFWTTPPFVTKLCIGRFSKAGLLGWMRFVIFHERSRKRSQHSTLPGRFLSRRCFTLCITVEVEPRIAKQYKCQYCCSCKNYRGKGMEDVKKSAFASFLGWSKDREFVEFFGGGAS